MLKYSFDHDAHYFNGILRVQEIKIHILSGVSLLTCFGVQLLNRNLPTSYNIKDSMFTKHTSQWGSITNTKICFLNNY